ncbi:MAG TPA: hypothetical protein VGV68_16225 [Terriglobia bacterium]|nr:hypothetical protein [Terriglobia bacterium]
MLPGQLTIEQFRSYPPQGRRLAADHLALLQQLPASFVPVLLREIIVYDWKFPAERSELERHLGFLASLSLEKRRQLMAGFAGIQLSPELDRFDWVNQPVQFSERLTAHLWATHQIDTFRASAIDFITQAESAAPVEPLVIPRLAIAVIGQDVTENKYRLFRNLRRYGVFFRQVKPENGLQILLDAVAARAEAHPVPFGHWYIDGGTAEISKAGVTRIAYGDLAITRAALLGKMKKAIRSGIGGPEALHTMMAQLRPEDLGLGGGAESPGPVLDHFQVSVLTEGSGTQIYSTTFVQWAAREALRRAQPLTLLARFAPRQRERPMNELIANPEQAPTLDPEGSLIDSDMGAYLNWVNQRRLSGADKAAFLVWFENHNEALAIGPTLPHGAESDSALTLQQVLSQIT